MQANDTTPRKGAMLLRKSRADEEKEKLGEFETLAKHEQELTALAKRMQLPIDDVYKELVSGNDFEHRKGFRELMDRVERREYAYVIVHAVDRLSRGDLMENGWILSVFRYSATKIVTPSKVFDPEDPMDLQQLQFMLLFSNVEYEIIRGRMMSGKEAAARDGQYIGGKNVYGYDKVTRDDRKKTLKVNKNTSKVVKEIFRRIADGETRATVANDLNRRGIPSPEGKTWTPFTVRGIVRNVVYIGKISWGKTRQQVSERDGIAFKKRTVFQDEYMVVEGLHDAIVSEEVWERANAAVATKSPRTKRKLKLRNPLATVLVCEKCGNSMTLKRYGDDRKYIAHRPYTNCGCRGAKMERVLDAVAGALSDLADEYMVVSECGDRRVREHEELLSVLESELAAAERKKDKLVELYTEGAIGISEFRDRRAPVEERVEKLSAAIEEERKFEPEPAEVVAEKLRNVVLMLSDDTLEAQVRNDALKMVVERITYGNDDGDIRLAVTLK